MMRLIILQFKGSAGFKLGLVVRLGTLLCKLNFNLIGTLPVPVRALKSPAFTRGWAGVRPGQVGGPCQRRAGIKIMPTTLIEDVLGISIGHSQFSIDSTRLNSYWFYLFLLPSFIFSSNFVFWPAALICNAVASSKFSRKIWYMY